MTKPTPVGREAALVEWSLYTLHALLKQIVRSPDFSPLPIVIEGQGREMSFPKDLTKGHCLDSVNRDGRMGNLLPMLKNGYTSLSFYRILYRIVNTEIQGLHIR